MKETLNINNKQEYFDGLRDEVAAYVPIDSNTILDIGCGSGNFGNLLKERGENVNVWGVELNAKVAQLASKKLDKIIVGDIEKCIPEIPDSFFDCITFNDSLEHMIDPFNVLLKIKSKLTEKGVVVSSIPNVRYYNNLRDLLFYRQWEYVDDGILDRTHLRFFTDKSIVNMYNRLGYNIQLMQGINKSKKNKVRRLVKLSFGWLDDIQYLQFVTRAKPNT
jgi:2-polyprenyl-3-methyl-5-hydroxy-6-metoxy-1,4-benzoquinol methylase